MRTNVVLTVSESKRLIAKGVAALDFVQNALKQGTVAIAKGTTNGYIVEEILGEKIDKTQYCTGTTFPAKADKAGKTGGSIPDVVLRDGQKVEGAVATEAVGDMKSGDVFIKGANALNWEKKQAALLIGHQTGGTIGATYGTIIARRIRLVIPIGLEKSVPTDLQAAAKMINNDPTARVTPTLWPLMGDVITEIEALKVLTGVDATPIAAGGIGGAEGAVYLCLRGSEEELGKAGKLIDEIQGEPPFIQ
ncbi:MAG: hypothetical protein GXP25_06530 [Planctomycetes bacterium]|nr:hypothetical protein [Planctomycetota bacterium]